MPESVKHEPRVRIALGPITYTPSGGEICRNIREHDQLVAPAEGTRRPWLRISATPEGWALRPFTFNARIVDPDGKTLRDYGPIPVGVVDEGMIGGFLGSVSDALFEQSGTHQVEAWIDGQFVASHALEVTINGQA